jgi:16S rRNA (guanine527-N7)-methyltransferase
LTAVRDADGILSRHFVESIACAQSLPTGIHTLLDFGSGAGFPGIPIALCRPGIAVTLAESQLKKAAFLEETVRVLAIAAKVHAGRAETLSETFHCVVLRAVDRMPQAVQAAARLVGPDRWLALMTTAGDANGLEEAAGKGFSWSRTRLPGAGNHVLALGKRVGVAAAPATRQDLRNGSPNAGSF